MSAPRTDPEACPCGGEGCAGVDDNERHQCGGPQEACAVPGCLECGKRGPRTDPEEMSFADVVAILAPWAKDRADVDAVVRLAGEVASSLGINADAAIMPELRAHNSALAQFDSWLLAEKDETAKLRADLATARAETEAALVQVSLSDLATCRGALALAVEERDAAIVEISHLRARVAKLADAERGLSQTIDERDYYHDEIARLAVEAGCEEEWTNAHAHACCIDDAFSRLRAENAALRARVDGVLVELARMDAAMAGDVAKIAERRERLARCAAWVAEGSTPAPAKPASEEPTEAQIRAWTRELDEDFDDLDAFTDGLKRRELVRRALTLAGVCKEPLSGLAGLAARESSK